MQPQDAHASGQRIRELGHEQHVGRAGQDEAARRPPPVDRMLERGEEFGDALHLVQDGPFRQLGHEADGVLPGRAAQCLVVEGEVAVAAALSDGAGKRRLAALARAVDQHRRRIGQRLAQAAAR